MLLVSKDQIQGRYDLDIFDGPMLVSEVAYLGNSLAEMGQLGDEAAKKLKSLPSIADRDVASTVYEFLVGAACVRAGRKISTLPASNTEKTPDFRVFDRGAPFVMECKRRMGQSDYAENEARQVERLYAAAAPHFERFHLHGEADFNVAVSSVSEEDFFESHWIALRIEGRGGLAECKLGQHSRTTTAGGPHLSPNVKGA